MNTKQHFRESAQIALLLAQRSASFYERCAVLPVGVVEDNFSGGAHVDGCATEIVPQEGGPRIPRDQVFKGRFPVSGYAQRIPFTAG